MSIFLESNKKYNSRFYPFITNGCFLGLGWVSDEGSFINPGIGQAFNIGIHNSISLSHDY